VSLDQEPGRLSILGRFGRCPPLLVILVAAACQTVGQGEGGQSAVYQGTLTLDGGAVEAALELAPLGGGTVRGGLQTGSGLIADGEGTTRRSDRLVLLFRYGGSCPGTLTLDGEWDQGKGSYAGEAMAEDCTGRAQGTFQFKRG
jgi:hypothetical protein